MEEQEEVEQDIQDSGTSLEGKDIPDKWKTWFKMDRRHSQKWRKEARDAFKFVAGDQWSDEDKRKLEGQFRPVITFNRTEVIIDAVSGNEINNRNEVTYFPREEGDAIANELYTEAARWFDDQSNGPDEDSEAFRNTVVCGMGWTESIIDYDNDPDGEPVAESIDPLEMLWDCGAVRTNLLDANRMWRMKKVPLSEAMRMFPDVDKNDLDSGNWIGLEEEGELNITDPSQYYQHDKSDLEQRTEGYVHIIHLQYFDREKRYRVADPMTNKLVDMKEDQYNQISQQMAQFGVQLQSMPYDKKVVRQAFLGKKILKEGPGPCEDHFSWQCITGKFDRSRKTWYGMIRAMKDPQMWANKWLAQMLHILNAGAKGGLLIEEGALADETDIDEFEEKWASPDSIHVLADGAIMGQKIKEKPQTQFPAGFQMLTEFAIRAIREVSGVSLELLGLRELNQPGVLETQRKQAGLAILAGLFNNLRRYRKNRGMVLLYYIHNYLSDGRLIRILGQGRAKYVKLLKQADVKYDVIVDESPYSVNQKEKVWESLTQIMPGIKDLIPPKVLLELLEYSPIPASVVQRIREVISAPDPEAQKRAQIAAEKEISEIAKNKAVAQKTMEDARNKSVERIKELAETMKTRAETGEINKKTENASLESLFRLAEVMNERAKINKPEPARS